MISIIVMIFFLITACSINDPLPLQNNRIFKSSFETELDFAEFYIVPKGEYDSNHELSLELKTDGNYSHKAYITAPRATSNDGVIYLPHRAYPTVQLYKTNYGSFVTPCLITFKANLNINLEDKPAGSIDDWFSFATLSPDPSDNWKRTVLVNIAPDKLLRLVHVPNQGEQIYIYQNETLLYPFNEWVNISIYIDFSKDNGYAKVWQNRILVSHAKVNGGNNLLEQAHFGLYASAALASGIVFNDELCIREVLNEEDALQFIK